MNTIEEIKNRIDVVDLIGETVKLRRSGKNYSGFCPFHANTRTPAFAVFPDSGTWRCFGECNEGGDIFKFVMKRDGLDFGEALRLLAARAGVKLEPLTPQKAAHDEQQEKLRGILEEAVTFYRFHLTQTSDGKAAADYLLQKRGLKQATLENWSIGYAPRGWDSALKHFTAKGYSQADLLSAGLLSEKEDGGVFDRFRHRIMFPIRDASGGMAGFGARVMDTDEVPKFLNSPQNPLFDKSSLLFGLDKARKPIRASNQAVIVEGYLDVIGLHQEGFQNVVSPMGTALTETQVRDIKRFTRKIVLALDPDAAGVKATLRGLEVARGALDRSDDVSFDARGLLRHEARLQADLRVAALPDGQDPDELVLADRERWQNVIDKAKPIIFHVLDMLTAGRNMDDPKTKSEVAAQVMPLIADVPNAVERDAYRQHLARTLRIDERALGDRAPLRQSARRYKRTDQTAVSDSTTDKPAAGENTRTNIMEKQLLCYLLQKNDVLYPLNRFLQSQDLGKLCVEDFTQSAHQQLAALFLESIHQVDEDHSDYINARLPEALSEEYQAVLEQNDLLREKVEQRQLEEAARMLLILRREAAMNQFNALRFMQDEKEAEPLQQDIDLARRSVELIRLRGKLDRSLASLANGIKTPHV